MSDEPQQLLGPLSQSILRDFWKDRAGNWSVENVQKFIVGMSKPPWWRWIARWKWRKLARNMLKPQDGLSGWKVIDCRNALGHLSDVVFEPESFVLHDPMPTRYNTLDDALADMKEGTRKRAIPPLEKVGGRIRQRQEYRDAPIGVGVVMCKDSYQIAYETKRPSDQATKRPRDGGDQVTKYDEIKAFWTIGEDLNWFGKAFVYTICLPFLIGFTLLTLAFRK